jgi:hypothetical protein
MPQIPIETESGITYIGIEAAVKNALGVSGSRSRVADSDAEAGGEFLKAA